MKKIIMKYLDKKGKKIKSGDTIFNPNDEYGYHKVVEIDEDLCFEDGTSLKSYSSHEFWEINN